MSVVARHTAACPAGAKTTARIWRKLAQAVSWLNGSKSDPYSPLLCISLLLAVGVIVKISPAIHAYLSQN
jgi:hypothetical protein